MRIGIIGGAERSDPQYKRVAAEAGHEIEYHDGHMSGRRVASLEAMVKRCDLVVITTDVNSHSAVRLARGFARSSGRRAVLCRRFGLQSLHDLINTECAAPA
jgi:hypothetical protein